MSAQKLPLGSDGRRRQRETNESGDMQLPRGVKVAQPVVEGDELRQKLKAEAEAAIGTDNDVFGASSSDYSNILKIIRKKFEEAKRRISAQYFAYASGQQHSLDISLRNVGFEVGEPLIVYCPYSVKCEKAEVTAKDLHTGGVLKGEKNPYPELDGFSSVENRSSEGHPIPRAIGILMDFKKYSDRIRSNDRVIVRQVHHRPDGDVWFFPLWEVPLTSTREAFSRFTIAYEYDKQRTWYTVTHTVRHEWELTARFESNGGVFYDGFLGGETERSLSSCYFMRTDRSSTEVALHAKRVGSEQRSIEKRFHCFPVARIGAVLGVLLGVFGAPFIAIILLGIFAPGMGPGWFFMFMLLSPALVAIAGFTTGLLVDGVRWIWKLPQKRQKRAGVKEPDIPNTIEF